MAIVHYQYQSSKQNILLVHIFYHLQSSKLALQISRQVKFLNLNEKKINPIEKKSAACFSRNKLFSQLPLQLLVLIMKEVPRTMASIVKNIQITRASVFLAATRKHDLPNRVKSAMTHTAKLGFSFLANRILENLCDEMVRNVHSEGSRQLKLKSLVSYWVLSGHVYFGTDQIFQIKCKKPDPKIFGQVWGFFSLTVNSLRSVPELK